MFFTPYLMVYEIISVQIYNKRLFLKALSDKKNVKIAHL